MSKVLISTAWWPTKSKCWSLYSDSIKELLTDPDPCELFITTSFADAKFRSIVDSMTKASEWALAHGFTHLLNIEADRWLESPKTALKTMLSRDKHVVVACSAFGGTGFSKMTSALMDRGQGWGVMLVSAELLARVPFASGYAGDYISPDRGWFKKLSLSGVDVWLDFDVRFSVLEPAATTPMTSFQP